MSDHDLPFELSSGTKELGDVTIEAWLTVALRWKRANRIRYEEELRHFRRNADEVIDGIYNVRYDNDYMYVVVKQGS